MDRGCENPQNAQLGTGVVNNWRLFGKDGTPEEGRKVYVFNGLNSVSTSEVREVLEIENDHVVRFKTINSQYTIQYL